MQSLKYHQINTCPIQTSNPMKKDRFCTSHCWHILTSFWPNSELLKTTLCNPNASFWSPNDSIEITFWHNWTVFQIYIFRLPRVFWHADQKVLRFGQKSEKTSHELGRNIYRRIQHAISNDLSALSHQILTIHEVFLIYLLSLFDLLLTYNDLILTCSLSDTILTNSTQSFWHNRRFIRGSTFSLIIVFESFWQSNNVQLSKNSPNENRLTKWRHSTTNDPRQKLYCSL